MNNKPASLFKQLQIFEQQIDSLEGKILELEQRMERMLQVERNHLMRVKNGEQLSDDFLFEGQTYCDLSPEKAWRLYKNPDFDFVLIDVSAEDYKPENKLPEAIHMPWEHFHERFLEITSHTTPLMIISEDGTKSILACEFLAKRGFFNCNNVSGGYKFWKGFRMEDLKDRSA